jgi:hypothetical protein
VRDPEILICAGDDFEAGGDDIDDLFGNHAYSDKRFGRTRSSSICVNSMSLGSGWRFADPSARS